MEFPSIGQGLRIESCRCTVLVMYEAGLEIGSFLDIVCSEAYVYKQTR